MSFDAPGRPSPFREKEKEKREKEAAPWACSVNSKETVEPESMKRCPWSVAEGLVLVECNCRSCGIQSAQCQILTRLLIFKQLSCCLVCAPDR